MVDVPHLQSDGRVLAKDHTQKRSLPPVEVFEPAGRHYRGALAGTMKNIIFVESQRIPSVGATVTVNLAKPILNHSAQNLKERKGTVMWICPSVDNFGFSRGFAVQLDRSRRGTSEKTENGIRTKVPAVAVHAGQSIMGRLGRTWRKPRYEVLGVL